MEVTYKVSYEIITNYKNQTSYPKIIGTNFYVYY